MPKYENDDNFLLIILCKYRCRTILIYTASFKEILLLRYVIFSPHNGSFGCLRFNVNQFFIKYKCFHECMRLQRMPSHINNIQFIKISSVLAYQLLNTIRLLAFFELPYLLFQCKKQFTNFKIIELDIINFKKNH